MDFDSDFDEGNLVRVEIHQKNVLDSQITVFHHDGCSSEPRLRLITTIEKLSVNKTLCTSLRQGKIATT